VGAYCEAAKRAALPLWFAVSKKLNATSTAAVVVAGAFGRGPQAFSVPLEAMGFPQGAAVTSVDVWTGADTGAVTGAWAGAALEAPGGLFRIFTLQQRS